MKEFVLDPRLANDGILLGALDLSLLLLMNNALVPWFILVPRTDQTELFLLPEPQRRTLREETDLLSRFVDDNFSPDKLNVAAIGNIVRQMHIHVVGRFVGDYCWPGVVWGDSRREPYEATEVERIKLLVHGGLEGRYRPIE